MATLKVKLLTHKKRADGKCPLAIRMTHNRKSKFSYIGYYILEKDWNAATSQVKKSYPNSTRLNNVIRKKLDELEENLMDIEIKKKVVDLSELKSTIDKKKNKNNFFAIANTYLQELESGNKFIQLTVCRARFQDFQAFFDHKEVPFEEITPVLLRKYKLHLQNVRLLKPTTVRNYFSLIRTIFNRAIAEGIVEQQYYPFGKGKITIKAIESKKIGLNQAEVTRLEQLELEKDSLLWHAQNIWLFSFYIAGIRISDVFRMKWTDVQDERLNYRMHKNSKLLSVKLPEKAQKILAYYKPKQRHTSDFIFDALKDIDMKDLKEVTNVLRSEASLLNKRLKKIAVLAKIDKNLTCHTARHTFGNISRDRIPIKVLQHLYRHSNVSTTLGYQNNFITDEADKALEMVVKL
ncbi:MAG: site-specific integrase [Bacteroidota bacterium]